jgi:hypothetical protein
MTSNKIFFTITLAGLFAFPLNAAENQQQPVLTPDSSDQTEPIQDDDSEPADVPKEQTPEESSKQLSKPAPQSGNLRARDIGDAFKNFQPSEEISADNAVTFPVDI